MQPSVFGYVPSTDSGVEETYGQFEKPQKLDLKSYLPVPRKQTKHNCVAWALGYANYSCQVCQERRTTKPSEDHDVFSPAYIYNKLNKGEDIGLHVGQAIDFMMQSGCASLETMPLETPAPDAKADNEALLFELESF